MKKTLILSSVLVLFFLLFSGFTNINDENSYARGLVVEVKRSNGSLVSGAEVKIFENENLVLGPKTTDCSGKVTWGSGDPIPHGGTPLVCKVVYCGQTFSQNFISPGSSTTVYINVGNPKCFDDCPDMD